MKIVASLLLFTLLTSLSAVSYAQQINLSFKNAPLNTVLAEIRHQSGYGFIFTNEKQQIELKRVTIRVKRATIQQVLTIFQQQDILSVIIVQTVTLSLAVDNSSAKNNNPVITGKVMNEKGEPLEGVTVAVKNSGEATSTGKSGEFRLRVVDKNVTLIFTGVGVESYETGVNGRTDLLISLKTQASTMRPVIVSTGYQELPKERATGSFDLINNKLVEYKVGSNILDRLNGNSTILFSKSGSEVRMQIRGLFTLTQNIAQPLIIVDGFPYEGNINNINPNDVESFSILKDAAASSIWGARAGNGVIVVTTKKGKFNQPLRVSFNTNITFRKEPDLFKIPNMSPADYVEAEKMLFDSGAYDADIDDPSKPLSPVVEILLKWKRNGILTEDQANAQLNLLKQSDIRNDFRRYLYRTGFNQQYAVNANGGTDKIKYFFSLGYDKGIDNLVGNSNDRITLRSDNTFKPIRNFQVRTALSYTRITTIANSPLQYTNDPDENSTRKLPLYAKLADVQDNPLSVMYEYREAYIDTLAGGKLLDWKYRPLQELANNDNMLRTAALSANLDLTYKFTSALSGEVKYQYQRLTDKDSKRYNMQTYYARKQVNQYTQVNGNTIEYPVPIGSMATYNNAYMNTHAFRTQLNFDKSWQSIHQLTALGGFELRQGNTHRDIYSLYAGEVNTSISYPLILGGSINLPSDHHDTDRTDTRFVSLYANASYTFNDCYLVTASVRKDASNLFGVNTNQKGIPLWSVGAGWKISKEEFYRLPLLSYLNLRVTYGFSGNVNNTASALTTINRYPSNALNIPYTGVVSYPNSKLRWEKVGTFNIGIDFAKDQRIEGSIEYFNKKSSDVLAVEALDPTVGVTTLVTNSAGLTGSGMDIQINSLNIDHANFKWHTSFIYNHIRYKVSRYSTPDKGAIINEDLEIRPLEGYNPYLLVSTKWAGLDANGDPQGILNGQVSRNYVSILNSTKLSDYHINGPALPGDYGNLMNTFTWKTFSVAANIVYKLNYFFRRPTIEYDKLAFQLSGHPDYLKRWQKAGDEQYTNVPVLKYQPASKRDDFYTNSEINVEKGDHIRLDNIKLSYDLIQKEKKKSFGQMQFYMYLSNMNILIWKANKAGIDPEFSNGIKPPFSIAAGIKVDFK